MKIVPFSLRANPELIKTLTSCYQEVFRAPPWNEDWWTDQLVMDELKHHDNHWSVSLVTVNDHGEVVGFCWGSVCQSDDLMRELGLSCSSISSTVLYLKDIGVLDKYRCRGLAKKMFKPLITQLANKSGAADLIAARTMGKPNPSVLFDWFQRDYGFEIGARYPAGDNRVVLTKSYDSYLELN